MQRNLLAALILAPIIVATIVPCAHSETRGPSTKEERAQAVVYARQLESEPFGLEAEKARNWLKYWVTEVPDLCTDLCTPFLTKSFTMEKRYAQILVLQAMFSGMAFVIEHLDDAAISRYQAACLESIAKKTRPEKGPVSVRVAGLEGVTKVYEAMIKANPDLRNSDLDELVGIKAAGALETYALEKCPDRTQ